MRRPSTRSRPRILCAGIVVLDEVFRVEAFPLPDTKTEASDYVTVGGGCAANAAVAIARLGGRASFAGPLGGPAGRDGAGDRILANLAREKVDCGGCVRVPGARSPVSAIIVDAAGRRSIATYRDLRLTEAPPRQPQKLVAAADGVLIDNRMPKFARPIGEAARGRGIVTVLDADKPTDARDPLFAVASHVVFSSECLRATAGTNDLAAAIERMGRLTGGFVAVTDGAGDVLWRDGGRVQRMPAFKIAAVDTLAAGDVFHGAFTLAVVEGLPIADALRFAAAAAAVKCERFGGSATAPRRAEVEAFLRQRARRVT